MAVYELVSGSGRGVSEACRMVLGAFVGPRGAAWEDTRVDTPEAAAEALAGMRGAKVLPALFDDATQTELPLVYADVVAVAAADAALTLSESALDTRPALKLLHTRATAPRAPLGSYLRGHAAALVCVTGASGFIAGHVIERLLAQGMRVRATVRPDAPEDGGPRAAHLWALPGARSRLSLVRADLLTEGSFDAAVAGCSAVHHCASPFFTEGVTDPDAQLIRPAVEGTLNVLRSCARAGVRRAIVTGSTASVYMNADPKDTLVDEDSWSDEAALRRDGHHYALSKLLAERAAWHFVGSERAAGRPAPELIVLCPTLVIGPVLAPRVTTSTAQIKALVDGSRPVVPNATKCMVDVRDVAAAHVAAQLRPRASGRYVLIGAVIAWREAVRAIAAGLPPPRAVAAMGQAISLPGGVEDGPVPYPQALFSQERAADGLGVRFTPIERSLQETVGSFLQHGLLPAEAKPAPEPETGAGASDPAAEAASQ
ncbi:hypothetical protein FNF27_02160 [Cafeteria roenbergensis]|uniref:NAD-dependent epimerase/dehydratase domain-containing protein n=2 Tax=Cafeteria roenbergensis TaxID=33653 RepID=A0A5A8EGS3_CAFRO|nr:hypothetical protein FNF27_02160 [Cafeteria roenbergensis]